jgi:hypothetical protein
MSTSSNIQEILNEIESTINSLNEKYSDLMGDKITIYSLKQELSPSVLKLMNKFRKFIDETDRNSLNR